MNDNFINKVTLDCLLNKEQYNRHVQSKMHKGINRKDRKFYKKRIVDLTRDMLSNPSVHETTVFPDVKYAFDSYIKTTIDYFKSLDNNDIIQEEYKDFKSKPISEVDLNMIHENLETHEEADKLLMRTVSIAPSLDGFIKRTILKKANEPIIPKQKDVNLKNPDLKTKGVLPKKKKEKEKDIAKENNIT